MADLGFVEGESSQYTPLVSKEPRQSMKAAREKKKKYVPARGSEQWYTDEHLDLPGIGEGITFTCYTFCLCVLLALTCSVMYLSAELTKDLMVVHDEDTAALVDKTHSVVSSTIYEGPAFDALSEEGLLSIKSLHLADGNGGFSVAQVVMASRSLCSEGQRLCNVDGYQYRLRTDYREYVATTTVLADGQRSQRFVPVPKEQSMQIRSLLQNKAAAAATSSKEKTMASGKAHRNSTKTDSKKKTDIPNPSQWQSNSDSGNLIVEQQLNRFANQSSNEMYTNTNTSKNDSDVPVDPMDPLHVGRYAYTGDIPFSFKCIIAALLVIIGAGLVWASIGVGSWYIYARQTTLEAETPEVAGTKLTGKYREKGLDVLRLVAVVHIIFRRIWTHHLEDSEHVIPMGKPMQRFASWGICMYTTLFMTAGFILAAYNQNTRRSETKSGLFRLDTWHWLIRRLSRTYPLYFVSLVAALGFMANHTQGRSFWVFTGLATWDDKGLDYGARPHALNQPGGWIFGAFAFCYLMYYPIQPWIAATKGWDRVTLATFLYLFTAWQACLLVDMQLLVTDQLLMAPALLAHLPTFLMGVLLGCMFSDKVAMQKLADAEDKRKTSRRIGMVSASNANTTAAKNGILGMLSGFADWMGLTLALVALVAVFTEVELNDMSEYMIAWVRAGMLAPLMALIIWGVASQKDPCSMLFNFPPFVAIAAGTYALYMLQDLAWMVTQEVTEGSWKDHLLLHYVIILPALAISGHYLVELPLARFIPNWFNKKKITPVKLGLQPIKMPNLKMWEKFTVYYACMIVYIWFCLTMVLRNSSFKALILAPMMGMSEGSAWWDRHGSRTLRLFLDVVSWVVVVTLPALFVTVAGQLLFPPFNAEIKSLQQQLESWCKMHNLDPHQSHKPLFKIHFRIVTRGNNPILVASNAADAWNVLTSSKLPRQYWEVEVVTDNAMGLASNPLLANMGIIEIVVPDSYKPPGGALFKARALEYAVKHSSATRADWVVHQDEESKLDTELIGHVFHHCTQQWWLCNSGEQEYGKIGQGVIKYNTEKHAIENLWTTLADSARVSDDYGKFAFQYRLFNQPFIGMHGSFVVCHNAVEIDITFDHGVEGSITEDTYFGMLAASRGVQMQWMGGHMYEQSPFSCLDLMKQRCRWYAGMWLCAASSKIPLWRRVILGIHLSSTCFQLFLFVIMILNMLMTYRHDAVWISVVRMLMITPYWGYGMGFVLNFSVSQFKEGILEYMFMLMLQLASVLVLGTMECGGVLLSLVQRSAYTGFHVVQKESETNVAEAKDRRPPRVIFERKGEEQRVAREEMRDLRNRMKVHWLEELDGRPAVTTYPLDFPRTYLGQDQRVESIQYELRGADLDHWSRLAEDCGATLQELLFGAVATIFGKYNCSDSVVLGFRSDPEEMDDTQLEVLPLMVDVSEDRVLAEVVEEVHEAHKRAMQHRQTFTQILQHLDTNIEADSDNYHPLAQVVVGSMPVDDYDAHLTLMPETGRNLFDVAIMIRGLEQGLKCDDVALCIAYRPELFARASMKQLHQRICYFIKHAAAKTPLAAAPLMNSGEHAEITADFNDTAMPFPKDKCAHDLFLDRAAAHQETIALIPHKGEDLSYGELAEKVAEVAAELRQAAVRPGKRVGLLFSRGPEMVAAMYGTLVAGGAFVPLEPAAAPDRTAKLLTHSGAEVLLVEEMHAPLVPESFKGTVVVIGLEGVKEIKKGAESGLTVFADAGAAGEARPSDPACVMYRAGAGPLCAVTVTHEELVQRATWLQAAYRLQCGVSTVLCKTSYSSAVSELEIVGTLSAGAALCLTRHGGEKDAPYLVRTIAAHSVTHMFTVPSMLKMLLAELEVSEAVTPSAWTSLKAVVCCGEILHPQLCRHFYTIFPDDVSLRNVYLTSAGPVAHWNCPPAKFQKETNHPILLGHPVANTQVYLLNAMLQPVPIGMPGEVCFGGGEARGYLNDPELTAEKFIDNPFGQGKLFRTGDMAMWQSDGQLKFVGSRSRQVMVRGYRVSLEEVEAALVAAVETALTSPGVPEVAVVVTAGDNSQLVAYVPEGTKLRKLKRNCEDLLPRYMNPSVFLPMSSFPRLASGKVDYDALAGKTITQQDDLDLPDYTSASFQVPGMIRVQSGGGLTDFMSSKEASRLVREGHDSLGIMRMYSNMSAVYVREQAIFDNMHGIFMFGIIFDAFWGCGDASRCMRVLDQILWPQGSQEDWNTIEIVVRAIGSYKCLTGFMLMSAYTESAFADARKLNLRDVVVFSIYMSMLWIYDPLMRLGCLNLSHMCDHNKYSYTGIQKWFLYSMMLNKAALVLFSKMRVPPFVQIYVLACLAFIMPERTACLSERCGQGNPVLLAIGKVFFVGPNVNDPETSGLEYAMTRWYIFMALLWLSAFHCGRPMVNWFHKKVMNSTPVKAVTEGTPVAVTTTFWLAVFVLVCLLDSALVGPYERVWLAWDEGRIGPQLHHALLSLFMMTLQPALLALALKDISRPSWMHFIGRSTLGSFVIHYYLRFFINELLIQNHALKSIASSMDPTLGLVLQLCVLILVPFLVQLTLGPLFHKWLLLPFTFIARRTEQVHKLTKDGHQPSFKALAMAVVMPWRNLEEDAELDGEDKPLQKPLLHYKSAAQNPSQYSSFTKY